jgi:hypothetical protein
MRVKILRWVQSLGFWGVVAGGFGCFGALMDQDWGIAGLGVVFSLVSYGWYRFFGIFTKGD